MHSEISDMLKDTTVDLCAFLSKVLPLISKSWWIDCVYKNLSFNKQLWIKQNRISSLNELDLSPLLRIFLKNWPLIIKHQPLSPNLKDYANEMLTIRNRWAHPTTTSPDKDLIERDVDTLLRFCRGIGAEKNLIEKIENTRDRLRVELKKPIMVIPPVQPIKKEVETRYGVGRVISSTKHRKSRDTQLEYRLKYVVGTILKNELHEEFRLSGSSQLIFSPSGRRFLCKFSSFDSEHGIWFWGVSHKYWSSWSLKDQLLLIFENQDDQGYSFILLDPQVSRQLLERCGQDKKSEKKINMRSPVSPGKIHISEWKDLAIESLIRPINKG